MLGETIAAVDGDLDRLPGVFQPKLAARLGYAWQTAVGFDLRFPQTVGERPEPTPEAAEMGAYMDVIAQLGTEDVEVLEALLTANQTFDPSGLRSPALAAKVEAWVAEGRRPVHTDPSRPPSLAA